MLRRLPRDWNDRVRYVMQRDGYRCHVCRGPANRVERVVPSAGYRFANLAPICPDCHEERIVAEAGGQLRRAAG
jgi:5-methylcytosine-specific restriction endonuclease McrA